MISMSVLTDAVRGGQVAGRLEHDHGHHDRREQTPVHQRQVNLPGVFDTGMQHLQPRQIAQLDDLFGNRERPEISAWTQ